MRALSITNSLRLFHVLFVLWCACRSSAHEHLTPDGVTPALAHQGRRITSPTEWLREHAVRLRSVDPADGDFGDLAPLASYLDGVKVVMLGEQTHGDGTTFLAKIRLIRFLHSEMGFDILAFESDMYSCREAARRLADAGESPKKAAEACIYEQWTGPTQMARLWSYLAETARSDRPLELWGFDSGPSGLFARESLASRFDAVFSRCEGDKDIVEKGVSVIRKLAENEYRFKAGPDDMAAIDSLSEVASKPCVVAQVGEEEARFIAQVCRSLHAHAGWRDSTNGVHGLSTAEHMNGRDAQMAENLLWLMEHEFPGRRVIVWAASVHIAKNLAGVDSRGRPFDYTGVRTFGQSVHEKLGNGVYSIGFLAYEGSWGGHLRRGPRVRPLEKASPNSLDGWMADAGLENAFVDLRGAQDGDWRHERFVARPFGYLPMMAAWHEVFDAVVFTRQMTPGKWTAK